MDYIDTLKYEIISKINETKIKIHNYIITRTHLTK